MIKAPNLNADLVDGFDARSLARTATVTAEAVTYLEDRRGTLATVGISVPVTGFVTLTGVTTANFNGCTSLCTVALRVRDVAAATESSPSSFAGLVGSATSRGNLTIVVTFPATAGVHQYELIQTSFGPTAPTFSSTTLLAQFSPFNGSGTSVASASGVSGDPAPRLDAPDLRPPRADG